MSNLDRAFIKAYDKSTNETSQSQRRASTRDVLLSISLRKQDGQTKRIEQPVESPQSQLGGPHMTFPVSMATGQHDVSMPDADLASSSVIVVPMAEIEPTTVTEKEPERPPRRDEENAVPTSTWTKFAASASWKNNERSGPKRNGKPKRRPRS